MFSLIDWHCMSFLRYSTYPCGEVGNSHLLVLCIYSKHHLKGQKPSHSCLSRLYELPWLVLEGWWTKHHISHSVIIYSNHIYLRILTCEYWFSFCSSCKMLFPEITLKQRVVTNKRFKIPFMLTFQFYNLKFKWHFFLSKKNPFKWKK